MGNKMVFPDFELTKLEDLIKPLESRAQQALSGVKKAVNLPAWEKLTFRVDAGETKPHFLTGHKKGQGRLAQSIKDGGQKTVFPEGMTDEQVIKAIKIAYKNSEKVKTQYFPNGKVVTLVGDSNGLKIKIHLNLDLNQIESAYPITGGRK
jgi:hypothetical protein